MKYRLKNRNSISRKHVVDILEWCKNNLGKSEFFSVKTLRIRISNKMEKFIGVFDIQKNCIYVKPKAIEDELDLIATIIHEYVHFQQDFEEYERIELQLPRRRNYFDHPHEREAENKAQSLKRKCFMDLKPKLGWKLTK